MMRALARVLLWLAGSLQLVAGLLAVRADGFSWPLYLLALLGILLAHACNNILNDLSDLDVGLDLLTSVASGLRAVPLSRAVAQLTQTLLLDEVVGAQRCGHGLREPRMATRWSGRGCASRPACGSPTRSSSTACP
ncbi:MAG: hypothetical protein KY463_14105, partial [Actinobacteria bacterium]|nr:hypothetical protein [Actinomycetota bacterium]